MTFFPLKKKSQLGKEEVAGFETWPSNKLRYCAIYG